MMAQPDEATGASARGLHYMDKDTDVIVNRGGMGRFKGAKTVKNICTWDSVLPLGFSKWVNSST